MVGITSYGGYIPLWRLPREAIAPGQVGERAIASFDEDSITMAVAAGIDCLGNEDRHEIDGLFFASTSAPYREKMAASIIAAALDLRRDIITADFGNSLRAGVIAIRGAIDAVQAGRVRQILVVAADCRPAAPQSDFELDSGDGAAAFLIADSNVAVEVETSYSTSSEMLDIWRADDDEFVRSWESRFVYESGYIRIMHESVSLLMKESSLSPHDFSKFVLYAPNNRQQIALAKMLGFDPKTQVQASLYDCIGNTGAAYCPMLLIAALEEAKPDIRILLASYGDGSDVLILRTTKQIERTKDRRGIKKHLKSKRVLGDYKTYLQWRGFLPTPPARRQVTGTISVSALWRDQEYVLPLHGVKCKSCGTIQYPPQRVCTKCHSKDNFEKFRLSDKQGKLFTYSLDYLSGGIEPSPVVVAVVDFESGGRMLSLMTDRDVNEVKIGMPLEMSFRKLFSHEGVHNYIWKSAPLRIQTDDLGGN